VCLGHDVEPDVDRAEEHTGENEQDEPLVSRSSQIPAGSIASDNCPIQERGAFA
jgi:hypothetical protein